MQLSDIYHHSQDTQENFQHHADALYSCFEEAAPPHQPLTENLFSYGTLRYENVQLTTFGRRLTGATDSLPGYCLKTIEITDPEVIAKSGENVHSIIHFSGNPKDQIQGMVFQISKKELEQADKYEVADYKRVQITLQSGKSAWVYVSIHSSS